MPLVLRAAKVSSLLTKSCGLATLCFSDQALFMMNTLGSCRSSTGLGALVSISMV
ncbi:Uncharacterised protein [Bordetella pertussis]|nr:Uncharacterised protein [Bordetella pertussis]CFO67791.1 Uncharacterised protein [Bordetella pertussis]CFU80671.1 Uncharacterised protein [Bordetella pertussis]CFW35657.1 Uncharacterised protein [Bordetella pertussis]CPH80799.1 Uncharacterised protein [Bordetella pertussis]